MRFISLTLLFSYYVTTELTNPPSLLPPSSSLTNQHYTTTRPQLPNGDNCWVKGELVDCKCGEYLIYDDDDGQDHREAKDHNSLSGVLNFGKESSSDSSHYQEPNNHHQRETRSPVPPQQPSSTSSNSDEPALANPKSPYDPKPSHEPHSDPKPTQESHSNPNPPKESSHDLKPSKESHPGPKPSEESRPDLKAPPESHYDPNPSKESHIDPKPPQESPSNPKPPQESPSNPNPLQEPHSGPKSPQETPLDPKPLHESSRDPEPTHDSPHSTKPSHETSHDLKPPQESHSDLMPPKESPSNRKIPHETPSNPKSLPGSPQDPEPTHEYPHSPKPSQESPHNPKPSKEPSSDIKPTQEPRPDPKPTKESHSNPKPTKEGDSNPKPTKEAHSNPKPTKEAHSNPKPTKESHSNPKPLPESPHDREPPQDPQFNPDARDRDPNGSESPDETDKPHEIPTTITREMDPPINRDINRAVPKLPVKEEDHKPIQPNNSKSIQSDDPNPIQSDDPNPIQSDDPNLIPPPLNPISTEPPSVGSLDLHPNEPTQPPQSPPSQGTHDLDKIKNPTKPLPPSSSSSGPSKPLVDPIDPLDESDSTQPSSPIDRRVPGKTPNSRGGASNPTVSRDGGSFIDSNSLTHPLETSEGRTSHGTGSPIGAHTTTTGIELTSNSTSPSRDEGIVISSRPVTIAAGTTNLPSSTSPQNPPHRGQTPSSSPPTGSDISTPSLPLPAEPLQDPPHHHGELIAISFLPNTIQAEGKPITITTTTTTQKEHDSEDGPKREERSPIPYRPDPIQATIGGKDDNEVKPEDGEGLPSNASHENSEGRPPKVEIKPDHQEGGQVVHREGSGGRLPDQSDNSPHRELGTIAVIDPTYGEVSNLGSAHQKVSDSPFPLFDRNPIVTTKPHPTTPSTDPIKLPPPHESATSSSTGNTDATLSPHETFIKLLRTWLKNYPQPELIPIDDRLRERIVEVVEGLVKGKTGSGDEKGDKCRCGDEEKEDKVRIHTTVTTTVTQYHPSITTTNTTTTSTTPITYEFIEPGKELTSPGSVVAIEVKIPTVDVHPGEGSDKVVVGSEVGLVTSVGSAGVGEVPCRNNKTTTVMVPSPSRELKPILPPSPPIATIRPCAYRPHPITTTPISDGNGRKLPCKKRAPSNPTLTVVEGDKKLPCKKRVPPSHTDIVVESGEGKKRPCKKALATVAAVETPSLDLVAVEGVKRPCKESSSSTTGENLPLTPPPTIVDGKRPCKKSLSSPLAIATIPMTPIIVDGKRPCKKLSPLSIEALPPTIVADGKRPCKKSLSTSAAIETPSPPLPITVAGKRPCKKSFLASRSLLSPPITIVGGKRPCNKPSPTTVI